MQGPKRSRGCSFQEPRRSPLLREQVFAQSAEPPDPDPYVRWCGGGGAARLPPIRLLASSNDRFVDLTVIGPRVLASSIREANGGEGWGVVRSAGARARRQRFSPTRTSAPPPPTARKRSRGKGSGATERVQ